jgi:hypothetical protein
MRDVGHDIRTLQDEELDAVSGGIGHVVAYRSLLETMADDACNI